MRARLAVAVSGGADSLRLLMLACETVGAANVVALAVDHGTRLSAKAEQQHAARLAASLGASFETLQAFPKGAGHQHWRDARYEALLQYCRQQAIDRLWLGQHADDALETVAIRALAGGPLPSLAGVSASRSAEGILLERPLLPYSSRSVRRDLMRRMVGWVEDPSNRSLAFKRTAVRQALRQASSQRADDLQRVRRAAVWRVAREKNMADAWALVTRPHPFGAIAIAPDQIQALPGGLAAEIIRYAALSVVGHPDRLRNVDVPTAAANGPPASLGGAIFLAEDGKWLLVRDANRIEDLNRPLQNGMLWDRRVRLHLSAELPPGKWHVGPMRHDRVGAIGTLASAPVLAALPVVRKDNRIVAIPDLGVWRGPYGPFWASHLRCRWVETPPISNFCLAPG